MGKNPYYFDHINVSRACFEVNSVSVPDNPFTPDFANNKSTECYHALVRTCELNSDVGGTV